MRGGLGSFVVIVATQDSTTVEIDAALSIAATPTTPAFSPGQPTEVELERHDILQIQVNNPGDLSGTMVDADKPIAVFGGHSCAYIPDWPPVAYCDHLQEQMLPHVSWGHEFVATRTPPRSGSDDFYWRVVAAEDDTMVEFDPPVSLGSDVVLNSGEYSEFTSFDDFHVLSDKPVLVVGYMTGGEPYPDVTGDPSMTQIPAVDRYVDDYLFFTAVNFLDDGVQLSRPIGVEVEIECLGVIPDEMWTPVGSSAYEVAYISLHQDGCELGVERLSGATGVGLVVSGTREAAAYAYPAAL